MKFNMYLFGRKYWIRVDRNPYYKSRRAIRKARKYWAKYSTGEKASSKTSSREILREYDASQQQWS